MVIQCKNGRRVKASDISDEEFIALLPTEPYKTISLTALEEALPYPWKVVLAKARTLITKNRGVHGCFCGCGGSFHRAGLCNAACIQGYDEPVVQKRMDYEKYLEANHISSAGLTSMAGTVGFDLHPWQKDWIDYVMSNDPDVKINYRSRQCDQGA